MRQRLPPVIVAMPLVAIVKVPAMMPAIVIGIRIAVVGVGGNDDRLLMGVLGGNHPGDSAKHGAEYAERNGCIAMPPSRRRRLQSHCGQADERRGCCDDGAI